MNDELTILTERWIVAFCETPVLLDAALMRTVLAETEERGRRAERQSGIYNPK